MITTASLSDLRILFANPEPFVKQVGSELGVMRLR